MPKRYKETSYLCFWADKEKIEECKQLVAEKKREKEKKNNRKRKLPELATTFRLW